MRAQRMVAGIALGCLMALGPTQAARAGLQIDLVYIENPGQPTKLVQGGGQLREIMRVAAENWMRIFKGGSGNWKLTIEYGWNVLRDQDLFAQEYMVTERGNNPSRINQSCILFNTAPRIALPMLGYYADPTPWDNAEYLEYTAESTPTDFGWLNIGRTFGEATGDAVDRLDLLTIAMHEIGHALGLDQDYSGGPGYGVLKITPPRPLAGLGFFLDTGPHVVTDFPPLMIAHAPLGKRQLISVADSLIIAQLSLFDRPDLSEPSLDFNGDGKSVPTRSVPSSSTCHVRPRPSDGSDW